MPRIKPPRSQEQEPVIVEVEDHTLPTEDIEIVLPDDDLRIDLAAPREPEPQRATPPADDDALVRAADATRRAEDLQRQNVELQRQNRERDEELARTRSELDDSDYGTLLSSISTQEAILDAARRDIRSAKAAGDTDAEVDAIERMTDAKSRLSQLGDSKQSFETRREAAKTAPPEARQPAPAVPPQDLETKIAALGVPDTGKAWLRKHPEFVNDTTMNRKIGAAHNYLVDVDGIEPFSTAYFDALDTRFGFKSGSGSPQPAPEPSPQPQPPRRSIPMSAPVSREVPNTSGQRQSRTMTLTPKEVEIARLSIPDTLGLPKMSNAEKELTYARNKAKLAAMKANGSYSERRE